MKPSTTRAEQIFTAVLELSDIAERRALLERECAGHPDLRRDVESLLAAHQQAGTFLEDTATGAIVSVVISRVQP